MSVEAEGGGNLEWRRVAVGKGSRADVWGAAREEQRCHLARGRVVLPTPCRQTSPQSRPSLDRHPLRREYRQSSTVSRRNTSAGDSGQRPRFMCIPFLITTGCLPAMPPPRHLPTSLSRLQLRLTIPMPFRASSKNTEF